MSFREKSAWIMTALLLVLGGLYFYTVAAISQESGQLAAPILRLVVLYTIALAVFAAVSHAAIAILAPKEANAVADERERRIFDRAGYYASYFFAAGVIVSLGLYLLSHSGDLLFYAVFASLMLGQIMEYVLQIIFYRRPY